MNIGVDAGCFGIQDKQLQVGVYQVAKNLLIELGKRDKINTYFLYSFSPIDTELLKLFGPRMKNIVVTPSKGWMKIAIPIRLTIDSIDLFLGLSQAIPYQFPFHGYRSIAFIYDIAFEKYPDMYPDSFTKLHQQTAYLTKHADHIIAISQTTKDDIVKHFGVSSQNISVAYLGVRTLKQVIKQKNSYFLFVGALKRIKNVATLITAFALFSKQEKKEYTLVIVGGKKWYDPAIDKALKELPENIQNRVDFRGFLDDTKLAALYAGATAFVSPSLYEGFGLPFVEAMAFGCPVIGSTAGSIPEVVGEAGLLVDPTDVTGIANAMHHMATDFHLRSSLQKKGKERANLFTWNRFTKEVLAVINKVQ